MFGSKQLASSEVRESNMIMWVRPQMVVTSLTQEGHTTGILQSSQAEHYLIVDMKKLRLKQKMI